MNELSKVGNTITSLKQNDLLNVILCGDKNFDSNNNQSMMGCKNFDSNRNQSILTANIPIGIYRLKVNNSNTRKRCEICSKLTIKTPERRHWCRSGVFIVNFEQISHLVLVFLLLTLNI